MDSSGKEYLVKASIPTNGTSLYSVWFTIKQKSGGRIRIKYLEESGSADIQAYMLIHMISQVINELKLELPQGLPDAVWHMKKHNHPDRFLEIKNVWYRLDTNVHGYWLNNSELLAMVQYFRDIPEEKVNDMVYVKDKKMYRILNQAYSPTWNISFHPLA